MKVLLAGDDPFQKAPTITVLIISWRRNPTVKYHELDPVFCVYPLHLGSLAEKLIPILLVCMRSKEIVGHFQFTPPLETV